MSLIIIEDSKLTRIKSFSPIVVIPLTVVLVNSKEEAIIEIESTVRVKFAMLEFLIIKDDKKALNSTSCEWINHSFDSSIDADSKLNTDLEEFSVSFS